MLTFDSEIHTQALQGRRVEQQQQQPNTAGKVLELRKAPGTGPLLPGVTGFCLEAFLTVAVNNAAAFLQATVERAFRALGKSLETGTEVGKNRYGSTPGHISYFLVHVPGFNLTHLARYDFIPCINLRGGAHRNITPATVSVVMCEKPVGRLHCSRFIQ